MASKVKTSIKIEGMPELLKQFQELPGELLEAANNAAIPVMQAGVQEARAIIKPAGRSRTSGSNQAHPPGFLASKVTVFKVDKVKRGKQRVWTTIGVPHGVGAAYYIPLNQGHVVVSHGNKTSKKTTPVLFLQRAFNAVKGKAQTAIINAINQRIDTYK